MSVEKVSVSFVPVEVDAEVGRMDSEGALIESHAVARAMRKSGANGGYYEDVSPEAMAMGAEGPGSIVVRALTEQGSRGVRGLVGVEWRIDRVDGAALGRQVRNGAIAGADVAANGVAKLHAPRTTGVVGNGKA
jgi:hypothetical protein